MRQPGACDHADRARLRSRVTCNFSSLPAHGPRARQAAFAREAAGLQDRFWEMHDLLYREQEVWSKAVDIHPLFNAYAGMLGLNIDRFKKDMESDQVKLRVNSDEKRGNEIGVTNTPTVFINNRVVAPPSLNDAGLRSAIKEAGAQPKQKPK